MAGGPGFGGWLKKRLKIGKGTLGALAGVASFVPGVGGIVGRGARLMSRIGPAAKSLAKLGAAGAAFSAGGAGLERFMPGGGPQATPGGAIFPGLPGSEGFGGRRVGGRRMNVANVKALRRSIRRVTGFKNLASS